MGEPFEAIGGHQAPKTFSEGAVGALPIRLGDFLPFLTRLPATILDELARRLTISGSGATLSEAELGQVVDQMSTSTVALELAERSWEYWLDERIDQVVPAVKLLHGTRIAEGDTSRRLYNMLNRNDCSDWSEIGALTPREVWQWKNAGVTTVIHLVAMAIDRGISRAHDKQMSASHPSDEITRGRQIDWPSLAVLDSLQEIVAWGTIERNALTISESLSLVGAAESIPREVQDAWQRLERVDPKSFFQDTRGDKYDLAKATERVGNKLEARQLDVLLARTFALDLPLTLGELGTAYAVTRERIRQLETKTIDTIQLETQKPENQVLARTAEALRSRLGAATPLDALEDDVLPDPESREDNFGRYLLLWLAGGYEYWHDWLVKRPSRQLVERSKDALMQLMKDTLINPDEAFEALERIGIRTEYADAWVQSLPGFVRREGFLVRAGAPMAERAEAVLRLRGEPMTREEIASEIDSNVRTLGNCLLADESFRRLSLTHFGLTEWGGEEYTNIVDELTEEIERQGGEARLDYLVESLTRNFGVSPNSVRTYAAGRWFIRTGRGTLRVNSDPSGVLSGRSIEFTKRAYRVDGVWAYRVTVTSETLRGSGSVLPVGVAAYLKVAPGDAMEFASAHGKVRVSWPSLQPALGTLRTPADALAAAMGDYLFVRFLTGARVDFKLIRRRQFRSLTGLSRVALEVGATESEDPVASIAHALGLLNSESVLLVARQRLLSRGEDELAEILNSGQDEQDSDALDRLTAALTRITARTSDQASGYKEDS